MREAVKRVHVPIFEQQLELFRPETVVQGHCLKRHIKQRRWMCLDWCFTTTVLNRHRASHAVIVNILCFKKYCCHWNVVSERKYQNRNIHTTPLCWLSLMLLIPFIAAFSIFYFLLSSRHYKETQKQVPRTTWRWLLTDFLGNNEWYGKGEG